MSSLFQRPFGRMSMRLSSFLASRPFRLATEKSDLKGRNSMLIVSPTWIDWPVSEDIGCNQEAPFA
jgi:hypothetical protein